MASYKIFYKSIIHKVVLLDFSSMIKIGNFERKTKKSIDKKITKMRLYNLETKLIKHLWNKNKIRNKRFGYNPISLV